MKKLAFLTVNNLVTNPRLLKELQLATEHFDCTVYAFKINNWSDSFEETLKASLPSVKFKYIDAGRKPLLPWLWSTLVQKAAIRLPIFRPSEKYNAYAHSKRTVLLNNAVSKDNVKYDLVIAHNLAALYPAYALAKKKHIPFAFDVEDYHPGEMADGGEAEKKRREFLMGSILPAATYISYASPLFMEKTQQLFSRAATMPQLFIPNCFPSKEFRSPELQNSSKLRLVWFSQHINIARGLEEIIEAATAFRDQLEIHFIGQLNPSFGTMLEPLKDFVIVHPPMPAEELHAALSKYDVGLAVELTAADANRDIALTNKIYAYAQAGLVILATDTKAQQWFVQNQEAQSVITGQTPSDMRKALQTLIDTKDIDRSKAKERYQNAQALSWENNSGKLLALWKKITDAV